MKRPTVADLAFKAGVSVSTVNRLMHGRSSVRQDTVDRIVEAAETIGFYGLGALHQRKQGNLPRRKLGFLLQQSHRLIYQQWAKALISASSKYPAAIIEAVVEFEDDLSAEATAKKLLLMGESVDVIAVVTADHPLVSHAIDQLRLKGVPVIAYISELSAASRAGFVGTDNWKAGRTAAWFLTQMIRSDGKIAPLIGNHRYQCQDFSDASFRSYIREYGQGYQILETLLTHEEPKEAYRVVSALLEKEPDLQGIFVNGGGISGVLQAIRELPLERRSCIKIVCRDVGQEARKGLAEGLISAGLYHPEDIMSNELIRVMLEAYANQGRLSMLQKIVPFAIMTPESLWT
jgi:LacI family transcriptional regulator